MGRRMIHRDRLDKLSAPALLVAMTLSAVFAMVVAPAASALQPIPPPDPKPGSYGLEAVKKKAPPTRGARITVPGNGASFSNSPITVSGICPSGLLVQVFNNGVMVGATMCKGGSFSMQVSLFAGENELSALVYDEIGQTGPKSNVVTVRFSDADFGSFGELITLTSSYGRRSAQAGSSLTWPLQLSGGTGPYAFSIDWGDGSNPQLMSQSLSGVINISHIYKNAGIYQVNVKVTDSNGVSAFLQLVAVANGQVDGSAGTEELEEKATQPKPTILWIPTIVAFMLLIPSYWLGRRSQLVSLRNKMIKERDAYQDK